MTRRCWIGTSGWVYSHWRHVFYPEDLPQKEWFAYYAQHFSTVEINNTFYRLPQAEAFIKWRKQAPPNFIYALKANRYITHIKRLKDCQEPLERFLQRAPLLGKCLAPILYQLPPNWHVNLERLEGFLKLLPKDLIHVMEFRDKSWLLESVFKLLEKYKVGFCIISFPGLACPIRATCQTVYIRMHGAQILYGDKYSTEELSWWAEQIKKFLAAGHDVFVYFNNDAEGFAVENAKELQEMLKL